MINAAAREVVLRGLIVDVAWRAWGIPYGWAGDDPILAFDCSGAACEFLKSIGLLARKERLTADGLWKRFGTRPIEASAAKPGDFVFWFDVAGKAIHVDMILAQLGTKQFSIGASGGGPHVKTREDAIRENAFLKVREVGSRGGIMRFCSPISDALAAAVPM